jgi:KEOPS complex subunit Cgi121
MIKIIGARGFIGDTNIFLGKVEKFEKKYKVTVQVFNADVIYGKKHLLSAFNHAKRAFERKNNTTNSIQMETLLYASGERQLKYAIPKMGIKKGKINIALLFITEQIEISDKPINDLIGILNLEKDDKVLEGDENTLKCFGLSERIIKTVARNKYVDLILERVALVDILK